MENTAKKAVIYARVSSDRQDVDLSISAQLKALREYAIKHGYIVIKEFVDEAESGRSTARPAFREMISLARMKHPTFEIILVWKLSRFARNREDSIIYKSLLRKQGIQVVSINEPIEDSPTGRLMEGIIEVMDEFYSSNMAEDITRGMRENASRGFFNGSKVAFGYQKKKVKDGDKERNTLEPNPDQAPIIKRIFNEVAGGRGLKEVAKGLNKDKILSPLGVEWGKQGLHKILTNEVYIGRLVYGKRHNGHGNLPPVIKDDAWPAIIDKQLFDQVQISLRSRAPQVTHPRVTSSKYLLSGLIKCKKCGAAYIGYGAKSGQFHYYVCGTTYSKGKVSCPSQHLPKEKIEKFIIDKIKGYILTDENIKKLIEISNAKIGTRNQQKSEQLEIIDKDISEWQGRLERLFDFIETRSIEPQRMSQRIVEVQDKLAQLKNSRLEVEKAYLNQRTKVIDAQKVLGYVGELREFIEQKGLFARKNFLQGFIKDIQADDHLITIRYPLPMPPDDITEETVSVLDIVPSGPPSYSKGKTLFEKDFKLEF